MKSNSIAYEYVLSLIASHRAEQDLADELWDELFHDLAQDNRPAATRARAELINSAVDELVDCLQRDHPEDHSLLKSVPGMRTPEKRGALCAAYDKAVGMATGDRR